MRRIFTSVLCAALLVSSVSVAVAGGKCDSFVVGARTGNEADGKHFYATVKVEALDDTDGSQEIAESEARIEAKKLLLKILDVPRTPDGKLQGVTEVGKCAVGSVVYVTVHVSQQSAAQAQALRSQIADSLRRAPVLPVASSTRKTAD